MNYIYGVIACYEKEFCLAYIRFYQKYLSGPQRDHSTCKYYPTCSRYAIEAIEKYGALKGGRLAVMENIALQSIFKGRRMTLFHKKMYKIRWRKNEMTSKFTECSKLAARRTVMLAIR